MKALSQRITSITLSPVGGYPTQQSYPMRMPFFNEETFNELRELATDLDNGLVKVTSRLAHEIYKAVDAPGVDVEIVNGWAAKRFAVAIIFEVTRNAYQHDSYLITGYTDHGEFHESMAIYFDRVIQLSNAVATMPPPSGGTAVVSEVVSNCLVLKKPPQPKWLVRLEDSMKWLAGNLVFGNMAQSTHVLVNRIGEFAQGLALANSSQNSPDGFARGVGEILKSAQENSSSFFDDDTDQSRIFSEAGAMVASPRINHHPFFSRLGLDTQYFHDGHVSLKQLMDVFEVDCEIQLNPRLGVLQNSRGTGAAETYYCNEVANILSECIPQLGMTAVSGAWKSGKFTFGIMSSVLVSTLDMVEVHAVNAVIDRRLTELFYKWPHAELSLYVDLRDECNVRIRLAPDMVDGHCDIPMFARGVTSNLVVSDENHMALNSKALEDLTKHLNLLPGIFNFNKESFT